jgi:hypothetical protein
MKQYIQFLYEIWNYGKMNDVSIQKPIFCSLKEMLHFLLVVIVFMDYIYILSILRVQEKSFLFFEPM